MLHVTSGFATNLVVVRLFGSRFGSVHACALQVGILHTQWLTVYLDTTLNYYQVCMCVCHLTV